MTKIKNKYICRACEGDLPCELTIVEDPQSKNISVIPDQCIDSESITNSNWETTNE